jgi:hypothetical protein
MNPLVVILIAAAVIIAVLGYMYSRRTRTAQLKEKFGSEYDRVVHEHGDPNKAERVLESRQKRVEALRIHPLDRADKARFADAWRREQARFVDDPGGAIMAADTLVREVMAARGYPVGDFEQRAADISVDHPRVVDHYRAARDIAERHRRGESNTEDLRRAMVHYRTLFEELLDERAIENEPVHHTQEIHR